MPAASAAAAAPNPATLAAVSAATVASAPAVAPLPRLGSKVRNAMVLRHIAFMTEDARIREGLDVQTDGVEELIFRLNKLATELADGRPFTPYRAGATFRKWRAKYWTFDKDDDDSSAGSYGWLEVEPVSFSAQLTRAVNLAPSSDDEEEEKKYEAAGRVRMTFADARRPSR
jgi:hypothetical protein